MVVEPIVKVLLSVILPPVGVLVHEGVTGHLVLNVILTLVGYIPGVVHALWRVLRKDQ